MAGMVTVYSIISQILNIVVWRITGRWFFTTWITIGIQITSEMIHTLFVMIIKSDLPQVCKQSLSCKITWALNPAYISLFKSINELLLIFILILFFFLFFILWRLSWWLILYLISAFYCFTILEIWRHNICHLINNAFVFSWLDNFTLFLIRIDFWRIISILFWYFFLILNWGCVS